MFIYVVRYSIYPKTYNITCILTAMNAEEDYKHTYLPAYPPTYLPAYRSTLAFDKKFDTPTCSAYIGFTQLPHTLPLLLLRIEITYDTSCILTQSKPILIRPSSSTPRYNLAPKPSQPPHQPFYENSISILKVIP